MNSRPETTRLPTLLVVFGLALTGNCTAHAEFYRWQDAQGHVRISNIPPQGVAGDGSVLPRYNPSSIAVQRSRLMKRLKARDAELEAARVAQDAAEAAASVPAFDVPAPK